MMKLISCHITGFGRLSDYTYDFSEGLNSVLEDNGWGKTTFCIFIKSMLFGMEYKARSKSLTERKHYKPWDGSVYGGSLTFAIGDKEYRVERIFGTKDKEDEFHLTDLATGKESSDYSSLLGEEIFGVDRESFEKSVFSPQDQIVTSMTDSLNAKIGDLSAAKDDMNNFDAAIGRIEDAKKVYSSRGAVNPGKLQVVQTEISNCREMEEMIPVKMEAYTLQKRLLREKTNRLYSLKLDRAKIAEEISYRSKREQELGAIKAKKELLDSQKEKLSVLDDFFAKGIPEDEEIIAVREKEKSLENIRGQIETVEKALPGEADEERLKELFLGHEISGEQFDDWDRMAERIKELRTQGEHNRMPEEEREKLSELKYYFAKKVPAEEELLALNEDVQDLYRIDAEVEAKEKRYFGLLAEQELAQKTSGEERRHFGSAWLFLLIGLVCLAGGFILYRYVEEEVSLPLAIVFAVLGVLSIIVSAVTFIHRRARSIGRLEGYDESIALASQELEESKAMREAVAARCKKYLSGFLVTPTESMQQMVLEIQNKSVLYHHLLEEEEKFTKANSGILEELSEKQLRLFTALSHYAGVYGVDLYQGGMETELMTKLHNDDRSYREYCRDKEQYANLNKQRTYLEEEVGGFFSMFPPTEDGELRLNAIEHRLLDYRQLMSDVERLETELDSMEEVSDLPEDAPSIEELQHRQQEMENESEEINEQMVRDNEELNRIIEEIDACEDAKERLEGLLEEERSIKEQVAVYEDAIKYLTQARDQFLGRYMGPLRRGLRHYLSLMYQEKEGEMLAKNFSLDMDLNVHYNYQGTSKEDAYLSAGYRDMVAFCARLALLDALYPTEQPLLILDDPFTDLDEEKIQGALALMREVAKERQMLYFTCHESRMP